MSLIACPACGHQISTEAAACPNCGHPNRAAAPAPAPPPPVPTGPQCYACLAPATTRCQSCGALSCAVHLESIYVQHGHGGAYELRCQSCYESAETWKVVGWVIAGVVVIFVLIMMTQIGRR